MARLRARTYAYLIGIGTPILLAGVLWWFRRQGGSAAPSDQLFALVVGAAMLGTAGVLLKRSLPTLGASLALLVLGFPQEILGMVILPSGGLYLIAAFIVGLTDVGEMVGEGIEAGKEGMEESGMNAPEMPSAFQDATDGGETDRTDAPAQEVPDSEAPEGPAQPVDAADVEPITAADESDADTGKADVDTGDADADDGTDADETTPDPEEVVEEHGPHHAPEVQVDQNRMHADDPSVGQIDGGDDAEADADDGPSEDGDDASGPSPSDAEGEGRVDTDDHAEGGGDADADEADREDATATGTPVGRPGGVDTLEDTGEGHGADEESAGDDPETPDDADEEAPAEQTTADEGDDETVGDTDTAETDDTDGTDDTGEAQNANTSDGQSS